MGDQPSMATQLVIQSLVVMLNRKVSMSLTHPPIYYYTMSIVNQGTALHYLMKNIFLPKNIKNKKHCYSVIIKILTNTFDLLVFEECTASKTTSSVSSAVTFSIIQSLFFCKYFMRAI